MFDEARQTTSDQLSQTLGEFEDWLGDNEYPVVSVSLTGDLELNEPGGLAVAADNDTITIGFLPAEAAEPDWRSYLLEELWAMTEAELRAEIEELIAVPADEDEEEPEPFGEL